MIAGQATARREPAERSGVASSERPCSRSAWSRGEAASFKLVGESDVLKNPDDDHTRIVFDPSIRLRTDQFLLKFRKPR